MKTMPFHILTLATTVFSFQFGSNIAYSAAAFSFPSFHSRYNSVSLQQRYRREPIGNLARFATGKDDDDSSTRKEEDDNDDENDDEYKPSSYNALGMPLKPCCCDVRGTGIGTGFYRNGFCSSGDQDLGRHTVCIQATKEFLEFSAAAGNDLSTPMPEYLFPGLKEGDRWCLCAARWVQAYQAGKAPKLLLEATHEKTLSYAPLNVLREQAIDKVESDAALAQLNEQREQLNKLL